MDVKAELLIDHGGNIQIPAVEEDIEWSTERKGAPGSLSFKVIQDGKLDITEGDAVRLKVNGEKVFYGFIFKLGHDETEEISVTAYDQLRYFKNKDTYVFENKTADQIIAMMCADFNMNAGVLENTGYVIPSRVENNSTLFDIAQNALDLTIQNTGNMFVLYDDFGAVALKSLGSMYVDCLIDEETGQSYSYDTSIDDNTYDKIKLTYDNKDTSTREVYIAQDSSNINQWGVLQYFDTLKEGENGQQKADALLDLYNHKTRNLSIKDCIGDNRVRAGSLVPVVMDLGDIKIKNYMLVEKCKHTYSDSEHWMDLTLRGGEFVA